MKELCKLEIVPTFINVWGNTEILPRQFTEEWKQITYLFTYCFEVWEYHLASTVYHKLLLISPEHMHLREGF